MCVTVNTLTEDILNYYSKDNKTYDSDAESKSYNLGTLAQGALDDESNNSIHEVKYSFLRSESKSKLLIGNLMAPFVLVPIKNRDEK